MKNPKQKHESLQDGILSQNKNHIAYWRKRTFGKPGKPLSQVDLARLINKTSQEISLYERGERLPGLEVALLIGAALRVPPQALFPNLYREKQLTVNKRRKQLKLNYNPEDSFLKQK